MPHFHERVPVKPFMRFLDERVAFYERTRPPEWISAGKNDDASVLVCVCREIGWTEGRKDQAAVRRLYRYRNGLEAKKTSKAEGSKTYEAPAESFPREVVEEALHCAGFDFADYYPEYAPKAELYPEYYCIECDEVGPHERIGNLAYCIWCLGREEYAAERRRLKKAA